ncbi:penicillin-binding protein [Streptomyces kunmingensis]|uniref:Penicillin-binding protein n=1 Tax=Streptomyces kunmingensis TaxID=68225 RepID=A0ABU6CEH8_9ACTN|nr:transglycosylase domain-containing protein [Streptomyces kunmingensis]MEB3962552.1 penicillin-binding protein [Streptomyces kunmingensis]
MSSDEPPQPAQPGPAPGPETEPAPDTKGTKAKGKTKAKAKRPKRKGWRRLIPTWRMLLGTLIGFVLLCIGLFALGYFLVHIPPANQAATAQSNVFLYAGGTQIARDGEVNRENVQLAQVPKITQHAVLAAEDRDFYSESAIDPKAMLRAAWNTVIGKGKQSGSTITQQYVKNYYLAQEQTVTRKVKEFFISIKLDREESKDDILEGYLNTSYFGRNAYGIQAAAQAYYGVDVEKLTAAQSAYLAALLNAPSAYDVVAHPENKARAVARWNYVMDGMVKEKWLSAADRATMKFPVPDEAKGAAGLSGQRGYLVQAVKDAITSGGILDEDTLATGGYRITTTLQKKKQDAFVDAVDDQLMAHIDKKTRKADRNVRAGGAAIDPATGKVLAMYGGIDYTKQYVNNATRRDYQVGSTFKPFVFTSAVENGSTTQDGRAITPDTVYDGTNKRPVQGWNGGYYAPANEDDVSYGPITVGTATDKSVNAVYAQMAVDVGPAEVKRTAIDLGLPENTPDLNAYPSIALGPATASVLDMTEAYATLANHGRHGTYTLIASISKDGTELDLPEQRVRQAVSRESADTTTSVLRSVVDGGTGTAAQAAGRPAAGKTGTAEEDQAAWFAGYTPDLATVVSVMGQDPETGAHTSLYGAAGLPRVNGGGFPAQIWAQFTRTALAGTEVTDFDLEGDVSEQAPVPSTTRPSATGSAPTSPDEPGTDSPSTSTGTGTTGSGTDEGQDQGTTEGDTQSPTQGQSDGGTTTDGGATDGGTVDGGTDNGGTDTGGVTGDEGAIDPFNGLTSPSGRRWPQAAER